jgi:heme exporter protein D
MDLGPHAFFIVAAYVATAVIVGGLVLRAVLDHRAQLRALAELEGRGMRRRSNTTEPSLLTDPESESGRGARAIPGERTA